MAVRYLDGKDTEYELLDVIGTGALSLVTKERRVRDGKIVVCKSIDCSANPDLLLSLASQLSARPSPPNEGEEDDDEDDQDDDEEDYIARFSEECGICKSTSTIRLYMDFYQGGDLKRAMKAAYQEKLTVHPVTAVTWATQLASALSAYHGRGTVHGDLKPSNALLSCEFAWNSLFWAVSRGESLTDEQRQTLVRDEALIKERYLTENTCFLTDSGLGNFSEASKLTGMIKTEYPAPESIKTPTVSTFKSDVFSLGCLLYALCTGHAPFPNNDFTSNFRPIPSAYPLKFRQAIYDCLSLDPHARPTSIALSTMLALTYYKEVDRFVKLVEDIINPRVSTPHDEEEDNIFFATGHDHDDETSGLYMALQKERPVSMENPILSRWLMYNFN